MRGPDARQEKSGNSLLTRRSQPYSEILGDTLDEEREERRVSLIAAHRGMKLIKSRRGTHTRRYCLRGLDDASRAVGKLPDGTYGLIKAITKRHRIGSWLLITEIEHVLAKWDKPAPRAWGERSAPPTGV